MDIPLSVKQFVAGFFDGDGCVGLLPYGKERHCAPWPYVAIAQSHNAGEPPELVFVQQYYGGKIYEQTRSSQAHRRRWQLLIRSSDIARKFLVDMADHAVTKSSQAQLALKYIDGGRADHAKYYAMLRSAKKDYTGVAITKERLTEDYIAGLFAAEGCVGLYPTANGGYLFRMTFSQAQCKGLLAALSVRLGCGVVCAPGNLVICGDDAIPVMQMLVPRLVGQKRQQVQLLLEYQMSPIRSRGKIRTKEENKEMRKIVRETKRLKKL
jgi:hypothetical protein